ncbi:MAG: hypothetical protein H0T17_04330 [Propionibacteriales bacterium]|nr:hypothetical protein [Propionibacteriales bacterium]
MIPIPGPVIASELEYRRERIAADFAAAALRRRSRIARREARQSHADDGAHRRRTRRFAGAR